MKPKPLSNLVIPLGFKYVFEPEDHELIDYLSCKANGEPLPCEGLIDEIDLYSVVDPGRLFDKSEEKIVYLFTKVKKVSENGKRIDRKVTGNRTWKGVDKGHPIYDKEGRLVGEKKNFNFMNKMKLKLGYNMTEFALDKGSLNAARFKDYVLCRIKRKVKKGRMAQEEDSCSSRTAIDREPDSAIKEEFDSSSTVIAPEKSLVTDSTISLSQCAKKYCSQKLVVSDVISFPQYVEEQSCNQNYVITNVVPLPQCIAGLNCCENYAAANAIPLLESAEHYCDFSGYQEGTSGEQIRPMVEFDNPMIISSELFEASGDWEDDLLLEFQHNDDQAIWNVIDELASSSPFVSFFDSDISF